MHVDAVAFLIARVGEVHTLQNMTLHGHLRGIPELALIGKFETVFTQETARPLARSAWLDPTQRHGLVEKLQLALLTGNLGVTDGKFACARASPPESCQYGGYSQHQQIQ